MDEAELIVANLRKDYPASAQSQLIVGQYYLMQGKPAEAQKIFEQVMKIEDSIPARIQLARIAMSNKEYDKALVGLHQLVELTPDNVEIYKGIITVYEQTLRIEICQAK